MPASDLRHPIAIKRRHLIAAARLSNAGERISIVVPDGNLLTTNEPAIA